MSSPLLKFTSEGIYCELADTYIDAWRPVKRSIITHGHADHARYGHTYYMAHKSTTEIMKVRLGKDQYYTSFEYGDSVTISGVKFSFIPAGHLLGSCQVKVEYKGEVWVATGDYKLQNDGLAEAWEPIPCHTIITECTFGLPIYQWRPQNLLKEELNDWIRQNTEDGFNSVIIGYSLGKAQRLLHMLETDLPIYEHGAVHNMTNIHRACGKELLPTIYPHKDLQRDKNERAVFIVPPSALGTPWLRKFKPYRTCMASGWMAIRGARRRRAVDKGLVLSDHADWNELHQMIDLCQPEHVICTHGYTDIFSQYLNSKGIKASTEKTEFDGNQDENN